MRNTLFGCLLTLALFIALNGAQPVANAIPASSHEASALPQQEPPPPTCVGCGAKADANGNITHKSTCPYAPKK